MDRPDLPPAEMEVMDVLWDRGEGTARDVHRMLQARRPLAYTTVATLLARLRERGYVSSEERGGAYVFRPLVAREAVVRRKLDDLVGRLFGGSLEPLAAYIAENRNLTPEQIATLEDMLRDPEDVLGDPENGGTENGG